MPKPRNRLNKMEMAVLRQEMGGWGFTVAAMLITFVVVGIIMGIEVALGAPARLAFSRAGVLPALVVVYAVAHISRYVQFAAIKKVLGFDPREQDRADGVIAEFEELRITRTELIRGYGKDARRIPLGGLTATVKNTGAKTDHNDDRRVHVTIKGPDTNFVYSAAAHGAFDARFSWVSGVGYTTMSARQFAALLNYEAGLLGAPQKKALQEWPTTSGAPETKADEKCTKVRCNHCQHVQMVPVSQETFSCEQCKALLKRRTASANSS